MRKFNLTAFFTLLVVMAVSMAASAQTQEIPPYKPQSQELYNTILHMDSVYFNAYNTCDMATQAAVLADSMEFYHDKGGLMTSKKDFLAAIKANICGKVTRVLVKGSIEVYGIAGFGAVEIGYHRFINHQESETPSGPGRFVAIWRFKDNKWQLYRVASLHAAN